MASGTHRSPRPSRGQRLQALGVDPPVRVIGPSTGVVEAVSAQPAGTEPRPAEPLGGSGGGRPRYLPALDGLRAVAVVAVIAYHLGRLGGGFLGVDVFFVLSGFLITRLLVAERESTGRISLRSFWKRRVRRLLPALLTVLPVVMLVSKAWLPSWRLTGIRDDALAALFYVANWRFVASGQSYFTQGVGPSPLRHTWSLGVEEQFYVLWPLLVLAAVFLARRGRRAGVAVLAGIVTVVSAGWMAWSATGGADLTRVYYGTDTRIFAMAAGALLATVVDRRNDRSEASEPEGPRSAAVLSGVASLGFIGLLISFVIGSEAEVWFYQGGFQAVAVASVLVVAGLMTERGPLARFLATRPMRWIGQRSYSIYLWSWPVQVLGRARFRSVTDWRFDAGVVVVTIVAASLSYALVERPVPVAARSSRCA